MYLSESIVYMKIVLQCGSTVYAYTLFTHYSLYGLCRHAVVT